MPSGGIFFWRIAPFLSITGLFLLPSSSAPLALLPFVLFLLQLLSLSLFWSGASGGCESQGWFRRTAIERLGAALDGSPARDLSNAAAGLLLECELTDPAPLGLRDPGDRSGATLTDVRRLFFCPSRPGELCV